jgi:hypothetical protein
VKAQGPSPWEITEGAGDGKGGKASLADRQQAEVEALVDRIVGAVREALGATPRDRSVALAEPEDEWQACKWLMEDLRWPGDWENERDWVLDELEEGIFGGGVNCADVDADGAVRSACSGS